MNRSDKAILVTLKKEGNINEALELARSAGYEVVETLLVKEFQGSRYKLGLGKALELQKLVENLRPDVVIIDDSLRSSQGFNLTKLLKIKVIDREKLILEIFEKRARTPEAKLQVKLAEATYMLPRIKELVRRVRLGEQPGLYGYGEYEVERYYDHIKKLQVRIRRELERVQRHRLVQREARRRWGFPLLSLAGYTGAGKTTLFNVLVKERRPVSEMAFTTLTTTTRSMWVSGDLYVLLTDTVGFISQLPHYMIEAFKSTLEELAYADIVLLVTDISDPIGVLVRKIRDSLDVLGELGVNQERIIHVLNKIDLVDSLDAEERVNTVKKYVPEARAIVAVSAMKRTGIDVLREQIKERIPLVTS